MQGQAAPSSAQWNRFRHVSTGSPSKTASNEPALWLMTYSDGHTAMHALGALLRLISSTQGVASEGLLLTGETPIPGPSPIPSSDAPPRPDGVASAAAAAANSCNSAGGGSPETAVACRGVSLAWLRRIAACARKAGLPGDINTGHVVSSACVDATAFTGNSRGYIFPIGS